MSLVQKHIPGYLDCGFIRNVDTLDVWDTYPMRYNSEVGNMFSDGHPRHGQPKHATHDTGGPFWSVMDRNTPGYTGVKRLVRGGDEYIGAIGVYPPSFAGLSYRDGAAFGPEAYKKMRPAQPEFNILNFLFELKDLPGMLNQRFVTTGLDKVGYLKNAGNAYLALKFGWESLFRDVGNMVILQRAAQKILSQLLRDEGRPIRRRTTLLNETETEVTDISNAFGSLNPNLPIKFYDKAPSGHLYTTKSDKVWASARFRYWLPDGPRDIQWTMSMLGRIFGGRLNPSVVYNAVPWSWLVDWISSAGDAIQNLSEGVEDRLATDYFYVMRERKAENRLSLSWSMRTGNDDTETVECAATSSAVNVHKTRVQGNPFGLYLSEKELTGMQAAILAALGASRS